MNRIRKLFLPSHAYFKSTHSLPPSPLSSSPQSPIPTHPNFFTILNNPSSVRPIAQQIHSQLITTGSLHQSTPTKIKIINAMLRNYAYREFGFESVALYRDVARSGWQGFNSFTYLYLIKGCDGMNRFEVHGVVLKVGFGSHVYVMTGLLDMYLGFGLVADARKVFDEMPERSLVTWNTMVTGSVRLGEVESAWGLFEEMKIRNVVSWTGMIDGFTRCHKYWEAFGFFRRMMKEEGVMPNEITCLAIFPAVANLGDLKNCQAIQTYGVKRGFDVSDIRFGNSLIDVYAKCGCVASASRVFEEVSISHKKNLVSWTSLISGFAMHGMAKEAVENFDKMVDEGLGPNRVTFLSLLGACSHGGLVEEGVDFFRRMTNQFQVLPDAKHYGCVIDMLARAGRLNEAENLALEIPQETENVVIWRTLLGACSFHGNVEMAERVTRRIQELERGYGGDYVLMSNILTGFRKFDDAEKMRTLMEERDVSKVPGHSL